jgi:hypothetical protein
MEITSSIIVLVVMLHGLCLSDASGKAYNTYVLLEPEEPSWHVQLAALDRPPASLPQFPDDQPICKEGNLECGPEAKKPKLA